MQSPKYIWLCTLMVLTIPVLVAQTPVYTDCIPEQELFGENPKWWYPGEPLEWAPEGLIDSLLGLSLDGFSLVVESPRLQGYLKTVHYRRFSPEMEVMYVDGDCRYISYNPRSRSNDSRSIVVGHNYGAHVFCKDGTLFFQNGKSNWYIHSQRLWHSRGSGEIHQKRIPSPDFPAERATVHSCDSGLFFIQNDVESTSDKQSVHFYHHDSERWSSLGRLNPDVSGLLEGRSYELEDYWLFMTESAVILRRKSDGMAAQLASETKVKMKQDFERTGTLAGRAIVWKGNRMSFSFGSKWEDIDADSLAHKAHWKPMVVPTPVNAEIAPEFPWDWGWRTALVFFLLNCVLLILLRRKPTQKWTIAESDAESEQPSRSVSNSTRILMDFMGETLDSDRFDQAIGLMGVDSPETRRSRRSQIVKMVNAETRGRFGMDLILRERLESDRRIMMYRIMDLRKDAPN